MLQAIGNPRSDCSGMSKEDFLSDGKTQRAVIESFIVIGEAARRVMQLEPAIRETAPGRWQQLEDAYDMRIILAHEYCRVDIAIVWTTLEHDLPQLEEHLTAFAAAR